VSVPTEDYEDAKRIKEELGISWGDYISPHRWHSIFDESVWHDEDDEIPPGLVEVTGTVRRPPGGRRHYRNPDRTDRADA